MTPMHLYRLLNRGGSLIFSLHHDGVYDHFLHDHANELLLLYVHVRGYAHGYAHDRGHAHDLNAKS